MRRSNDNIDYELWEDHFAYSKKDSRQDRKNLSQKDRSKYKKTDRVKTIEAQEEGHKKALRLLEEFPEKAKKAQVLLIRSQDFHILLDGAEKIARLRGTMKGTVDSDKNLLVVGDEVVVFEAEDGSYTVEAVLPRRSILCRQDNLNRVQRQLIAANASQVLITVSLKSPVLRPGIIDRYIIAALKGNIQPVLVINKIDLLESAPQGEQELFHEISRIYPKIGIPVIPVSAETKQGLSELSGRMKDQISVFSGQSGCGKSSLINALLNPIEGMQLKTGKTVDRTKKGCHTTTFAQIIPLPNGGMCIDTPGIKSFGIWELSAEEVRDGFSEFAELKNECQFTNCWHRDEVGCAVRKAVETGSETISSLRYAAYLSLMNELEEKRKRR